jgi:hypothetical protein
MLHALLYPDRGFKVMWVLDTVTILDIYISQYIHWTLALRMRTQKRHSIVHKTNIFLSFGLRLNLRKALR